MTLEEIVEAVVRRAVRDEVRQLLSEYPKLVAPAEDRRVTAAEAATAAGLASPSTIRAWANEGKIKRYGEGRAVRYSLAEVLSVRPTRSSSEETMSTEAWADQIRKKHG